MSRLKSLVFFTVIVPSTCIVLRHVTLLLLFVHTAQSFPPKTDDESGGFNKIKSWIVVDYKQIKSSVDNEGSQQLITGTFCCCALNLLMEHHHISLDRAQML